MFEAQATAPMELRDYLGILRRRAWVIVLVTAVVVGAAAAWSFTRPNEYEASGTLVVSTSDTNGGDVANQADIIQSEAVHALAEQASPGVGGVTANPGTTGGTITVTSTSRNPAQAVRTVNAHVDAYLAYLRQQAQHQFDVLNQDLQPKVVLLQQQIAALDQQIDSRRSTRDSDPGRRDPTQRSQCTTGTVAVPAAGRQHSCCARRAGREGGDAGNAPHATHVARSQEGSTGRVGSGSTARGCGGLPPGVPRRQDPQPPGPPRGRPGTASPSWE